MNRPTKICAFCGRQFTWRKKWAGCWEQVVKCSRKCKSFTEAQILQHETRVLAVLEAVKPGEKVTIVEIATALAMTDFEVHSAARRLALADKIQLFPSSGKFADPTDLDRKSAVALSPAYRKPCIR